MVRVSKASWDRLKLGPGIIGHAAAEGGWYAVIVYAIVGGLFFRFFDEIITLNLESPFVVLAVGSAMGHYIGLPRGSVPNFAFLAVMTVAGALVMMVMLGRLSDRMAPAHLSKDDELDDSGEWEYDEAR